MASLARRLAPAAALGGLAVVIVGVADPAIANLTSDAPATDTAPVAAAVQDTATQDTATQDTSGGAATCSSGEQVTGDAVMTPWGPVQVAASVDNGTVCFVQAVDWPQNDRKSQMINSYAIPELDSMASQVGTQFDYVSGATYTSDAYQRSLQSLLDRL